MWISFFFAEALNDDIKGDISRDLSSPLAILSKYVYTEYIMDFMDFMELYHKLVIIECIDVFTFHFPSLSLSLSAKRKECSLLLLQERERESHATLSHLRQ